MPVILMKQHFNIRVYGLLFNRNGQLLLSRERYRQMEMLKFPGGGLEWGEGVLDALRREFREELSLEVAPDGRPHVSEPFIQSAFSKEAQIVAVHYCVRAVNLEDLSRLNLKPTAAEQASQGARIVERFWQHPRHLDPAQLTFEMDREAIKRLVLE